MKPALSIAFVASIALLSTAFATTDADAVADAKPGWVSSAKRAAEPAVANDNRTAAGRMVNGVLHLDLDARLASWRPDLDVDSSVTMQVFAESGKPASVPGPLLRVTSGNDVVIRLHNTLTDSSLIIAGLRAGTVANDTLHMSPGASREIRFRAGAPGTFLYWGNTSGFRTRRFANSARDAGLAGAIVVDSVGAQPDPRERIFVLSAIDIVPDSARGIKEDIWKVAINGRSWPHTERLEYAVGDTVKWRFINASYLPHPMHLHGNHFRVTSKGAGFADTVYAANQQREVVTELMLSGTTFSMEYVPTQVGNWLMHCHMIPHTTPFPERADSVRSHDAHDISTHPRTSMAGLILGVTTVARPSARRITTPPPVIAKRIRVFANERTAVRGRETPRSFVVQNGAAPRRDSVAVPSNTLFLTRGTTTAVTVVNNLAEATTVHWHGLELESVFDGVAGWSGGHTRMAPLVAPRDSFAVVLTPPRSGTFIYHTHMDEGRQLSTGMYGALIVLEPGARFNPQTDHVLIVGNAVNDSGKAVTSLNGRATPAVLSVKMGTPQRLRFINILPAAPVRISLLSDSTTLTWQHAAKDGATLPKSRQQSMAAKVLMGSGETYDYLWIPPGPGRYVLQYFLEAEEVTLRQVVDVRPD